MNSIKDSGSLLTPLETRGYLTVVFLLLAEGLAIGFVIFAGLFTLEMLLPTFVTARISLAGFLTVLLLLLLLLLALGERLKLSFSLLRRPPTITIVFFALWSLGLLIIGLRAFPLWSIIVLITLLGVSLTLFGRLLLFPSDTPPSTHPHQ